MDNWMNHQANAIVKNVFAEADDVKKSLQKPRLIRQKPVSNLYRLKRERLWH
jgi:cytochrome c oxidase cbb3-type subunit I/II